MSTEFLAVLLDKALDAVSRMRRGTPSPREQGAWGERAAARFLRERGWRIVSRNARPAWRDKRLEIDIVARRGDELAFVEVKTHRAASPFAPRLWAVDARKRRILAKAIRAYLRKHPHSGAFHCDVVEIYGSCRDGAPAKIDHIENINLPMPRRRRGG